MTQTERWAALHCPRVDPAGCWIQSVTEPCRNRAAEKDRIVRWLSQTLRRHWVIVGRVAGRGITTRLGKPYTRPLGSVKSMLNESHRHQILLVEDDLSLAAMVADFLAPHDFDVSVEGRGDRAVDRILQEQPDAVVLDVNLPGKDGFAVCREVRSQFQGAIIMLTARGEEVDEVMGLELGADDYMAKPVRPRVAGKASISSATIDTRRPRGTEAADSCWLTVGGSRSSSGSDPRING